MWTGKVDQVDVIVFEYLEMQGKISGNKKQRLHLWRKRDIQKLSEHQAHRKGIRVSRVNARNTSRLAYDGSGPVVRDPENHSLCTFQTGKQYPCDLSVAAQWRTGQSEGGIDTGRYTADYLRCGNWPYQAGRSA